jgi:hypothetical protein
MFVKCSILEDADVLYVKFIEIDMETNQISPDNFRSRPPMLCFVLIRLLFSNMKHTADGQSFPSGDTFILLPFVYIWHKIW